MALSPTTRVGIIVFLAIIAFGLVYWFLTGYGIRAEAYRITAVFDSAMGIIQGAEVRMAGVRVGVVETISLTKDQRARLVLLINRRYRIPEGSRLIVRVGLLIGERYIEVAPNREAERFIAPGATVLGEVPPRMEDLLPEAQLLVHNLAEVAEGLKDFIRDEELQGALRRSAANVEEATARMNQAVASIQGTVVRNQDDIDAVVANIREASESMQKMAANLEAVSGGEEIQQDIRETARVTRGAVESLERVVTSLEQLVTAPEFQEDVRETASGARQAIEEAREVISRVGRIFGGRGPRLEVPTRETNLDMLYRTEGGRLRAELSTAIPLRGSRFLELGIFDVGAGNKFILQPGHAIDGRTDLRYGIYASRLGIGVDHSFSSRTFARMDVFDPVGVKLNIRAGYRVSEGWGVLLGVDDAFGNNQPTLGVQLSK